MKQKRIPPLNQIAPAAAPRKKRWWRIAAVAVAVYAVLGFLIVPAIVKWQLRKQLPGLTHRHAEVKQVRINPFALSLTIRGLALTETNGTSFAAFDEFYANFQLSSLFHLAWTFDEIRLVHPTAKIERDAAGRFNFANLAATNAAASTNPPGLPPALLVRSLVVTNALLTVTDAMTRPAFHTTYGPINVDLTDFATQREAEEPYRIVATTPEGETFTWSGRFSLSQLRSRGQLLLSGIPPKKYGPYLAHFSTVQVQQGTMAIGATYRVNLARTPVELDVTNGIVEVQDLRVKAPERDDVLLAIDHFKLADLTASLTGRVARVGAVQINGGAVFLERDTNGQPVVLSYLTRPEPEAVPAVTATVAAAQTVADSWQIHFDELAVTNFHVAVEDHAPPGGAQLGLDNLTMNLKGLSNESNAPIALTLGFDWRGGGTLYTETRGTLLPLDLTTTLAITNLAIPPVQPYLAQFLNLVVHSGDFNLNVTAKFNPAAAPQFQLTGDLGVTNLASSDTVAYHELASWHNHTVRGIDFTLNPTRLDIDEIKFVGARNNIVISSNGQVNVVALIKLPTTTNAPVTTPATNKTPFELFPIHVNAVVLEQNSFRAADDTLLRRFETHVEEINGSIRDFKLPGLNKASVDIRGKVSSLAPFEITGSVTPDPNNLFVDLKVAFTNTDLTSLSPYTEKFVGRPLTKGKVTTEEIIHIENRKLDASIVVDLAQLTLGARMESPFATKLPVKLAIGLMKDTDGHILLDLPVSGSLDDPQFSVWGLVGQALQNMILKVAASPFSLIGALAGGGGEELQFVDFAPGLAQVDDSQTNKLFKLSTALTKRPALTLEIGTTFDAVRDVDALGRQKVAEQMKTVRIEEIVARGKPAPPRSEIHLDENEYERLLRLSYRNAFNTTPEQAIYEKLAAVLATNAVSQAVPPPPIPAANRELQKGATLLLSMNRSLTQLAATTQKAAGSTEAVSAGKSRTEKELVRDELEQRLATLAPVTPDELRALMQRRIETIQQFLIERAAIAADRVLQTTPNPEDPNRKGAARVVFSLD